MLYKLYKNYLNLLERYHKVFEGKSTITELMGDVNIRLCAPINTPSGMNRPHNITRKDGFRKQKDGSERPTLPRNEVQDHMFEAYVNNVSIDTFDFMLVNINKNIYNPVSEYLWHIPTGWLGASLIGQLNNPHVIQRTQNSYSKDFEW